MTTAGDIVSAAFREGNLIAPGETATDAENTETLALLNNILLAVPGFSAGQELYELNIGGAYDQSQAISEFIPPNVRLVLDMDGSRTMKLHPIPHNGQRLALADAGNSLGTNNLTLDGNGHQIEGSSSLTINTNADNRQWLYRADLGSWVKLAPLLLTDTMPFPQEFDDYFSIMLFARIAPRHEMTLNAASASILSEREAQMQARYRQPRPLQDWGSLGLYANRRRRVFGGSTAAWQSGRTW